MTESIGSIFPRQSVPLSNAGVQQLLAQHSGNPTDVQVIITALQSAPKETIIYLFQLNPSQQAAINAATEADLAERIAPAIQALQEGQFTGWTFDPGNVTPDLRISGGGSFGPLTCHFEFVSS